MMVELSLLNLASLFYIYRTMMERRALYDIAV